MLAYALDSIPVAEECPDVGSSAPRAEISAVDAAAATIPFGKWQGATLAWLAEHQLGYLHWLNGVPWLYNWPEFEAAFLAYREANPMLFLRL